MNLFSNKKNKGFSLIELIVSVAIFTIITSLILAKHSKFSGTLLLENLAYDVALSIRKAQVFGLSVREFNTGVSDFDVGYGVHFDSSDDKTYVFFSDTDREEDFDADTEVIDTFNLRKGNYIYKFCGVLSDGTQKCSNTGDITSLDIIFERPNPEAIIKSNIDADDGLYVSALITVASSQGTQWNVSTVVTGQISIQKP